MSTSLSNDKPQRKLMIVETKAINEAATFSSPVGKLNQVQETNKTPMATSVQMARIIQGTYMNAAALENKEHERQTFLD